MNSTLLALLISTLVMAGVLVLVATRAKRNAPASKPRSSSPSETRKPTFKVDLVATNPLTTTEATFFRRLSEALPEAIVVPQMAMAALIDLAPHLKSGRYLKYLDANRSGFAQKRIDFVVLDRETLEVVCAVELDDHTHDSVDRKVEDSARDALMQSVGYTVLRFDCRQLPSVSTLRKAFGIER